VTIRVKKGGEGKNRTLPTEEGNFYEKKLKVGERNNDEVD